jgi:hypothetical protein
VNPCCVCGELTTRSIDVQGYPITLCSECERESEEFLEEKAVEVHDL